VVGNGFDPKTTIGPVQNAMQYEKARRYLDIAHRDGNVIAGGTALGNEGYFIAPTIVRDIDDNSELVTEEQFAPILPVVRFDDIEVALACANRLPFGLGGSVWTSDIEFGRQLARRLEVGSAWVNQHLLWGPHVPMAGAKQSGIGSQFGDDGLLEYTQRQVVWSASDAPS
jgi:aldehyde dehydrogenase (NAD+)